MKIPFYQTTWNDIDLVALAREIEHPLTKLPDGEFYNAYYEKLLVNPAKIKDEWKLFKQQQTTWLQQQIDTYGSGKTTETISVGAGTGIVELPLIKAGYPIHLQEWQQSSLNVLGAADLTTCYCGEIKDIQGVAFDIVVAVSVTYALDDAGLKNFFSACSKLLKKSGVLIILDISFSWWDLYVYFRNKNYYINNCLLWGYKRSVADYKKFAVGLNLISHGYYDSDMQTIKPRTFLGSRFNMAPYWQMVVFKI